MKKVGQKLTNKIVVALCKKEVNVVVWREVCKIFRITK